MTKIYDALRRFDEQTGLPAAPTDPTIQPQTSAPPLPAAVGAGPMVLAPCPELAVDWMIELRRKLQLNAAGAESAVVVQIAGPRAGEGVSTVAQNLATVAAAHAGDRVLLINPQLARDVAVPDLLESFRQDGSLDAGINPSGHANLSLALLGRAQLSDRLGEPQALFTALRGVFDLIVIDCGSVDRWVNEQMLCKVADGMLLVVRAEHTRWPEVEQTLHTLDVLGAKITGLVLNQRRNYLPKFLSRFQ